MFVQVNLMQYMKLSTSRDFRINAATLEAALQEQDDSLDVSSCYETNTFTLNSCGSVSCPFSDHRVSAGRGHTKAQTEEEKTLGLVNGTSCPGGKSSCGESAGWSSERYLPLSREPWVMLMTW